MLNQLKNHYDIVINGGGIVGFTLLNLIRNSKYLTRFKILLIEQGSQRNDLQQPSRAPDSPASSPSFSNRVSSLTRSSIKTLQDLGVWDKIDKFSKDVRFIKVWNDDYRRRIVFDQNESKDDIVFSVVENNRLSLAILNNIYGSHPTDLIIWNHSLNQLEQSLDHPDLIKVNVKNKTGNNDTYFTASLILGCDGFNSKVRQFGSFNYNELKLGKTALVGTVRMSPKSLEHNSANEVAFQRFSRCKDAVAALLPLDEQYSSFVISAPDGYAKYLRECDDDKFLDEFNELLASSHSHKFEFLSNLESIMNPPKIIHDEPPKLDQVVSGSRASFPLVFGTTSPRMIAPFPKFSPHHRIALLGDATHRIHPLAGQGLNLGIQDAVTLVKHLENAAKSGERLFDFANMQILGKALRRYEIERQSYIIPMMASIWAMPYLFKLAQPSVLSLFDKCNIIKSASVEFANGPK